MSNKDLLDIHSYLHGVKESDKEFAEQFKMYTEKYAL